MVLLDTNIVIALLNGRMPSVRARYSSARAEGTVLALSTVVLFELEFGVAKSVQRARNATALNDLLRNGFQRVAFDVDDARIAADLRAHLQSKGTPIGPYDLLIAAQSLRLGATLVTANTREFARVPNLSFEDWSATP